VSGDDEERTMMNDRGLLTAPGRRIADAALAVLLFLTMSGVGEGSAQRPLPLTGWRRSRRWRAR
jgi:hypothetical protein